LVEGIASAEAIAEAARKARMEAWRKRHYPTAEERAEKRSAAAKKAAATRAAKRAAEEARMAEVEPVKVGDIFYSSWGYDQTNVDFFEVISVSASGKTAEVVGLSKDREYRGSGSDSVVARPGSGNQEKARRVHLRLSTWGGKPSWYFSVNSYSSASMWDGRPMHETAMGWGH
jgi:hypothetical protein